MNCQVLQEKIQEERKCLLSHPLYKFIESPHDLKIFMEHHVFAVWDFMSLLKALQQQLTCLNTPWYPVGDPQNRYLINEIVLAEETDLNLYGKRQSHFEMYLDAMKSANANTIKIDSFIEQIKHGTDIFLVLSKSDLPESVKLFLNFTFNLLEEKKAHKIAAAFTFGREELIPDMFTSIIEEIQLKFPEQDLKLFSYYFKRHIELDEDEHGPMALKLVEKLCGNDETKWQEAEDSAKEALQIRIQFWDGIAKEIKYFKALT
ncbi:DUF3050 domain-containing protein [Psychroflexus salis]|uniref:DUF3050 domain-containing protein n=1 Tax=Psychroflexus salis TaxID=1526574 RepID=A0A917A0H9_9FLAO|nr:DUF3050 domain-containing protein [Psychroflexus salis]GGE20996.1 hypothetical protein GCM10010831_22590 [Psychroflexus salis]